MGKKWIKRAAIATLILLPVVVGFKYQEATLALRDRALHLYPERLGGYPEKLRIALGPDGGLYKKLSERLVEAIRTANLVEQIQPQASGGSLQNLQFLQAENLDGQVDFALYQPGTMEQVWKDYKTENVRFVANLYSQPAHWIVRRDAHIIKAADLMYKPVQIGNEKSGDYAMSLMLLEHFGLEESDIDARSLTYEEVRNQFEDGTLDAAFVTIGIQAPIFEGLFRTEICELKPIPFADALIKKHVSLYPYTIPKGLYYSRAEGRPATDIQTVALGAQLLTREDMHAGLVREVTGIVMSKDFQRANNLGELMDAGIDYSKFALKNPEFDIHRGAQSFYDPDFDIHVFEAVDALYSLAASVLIAGFFVVRGLRQRRGRKKEHKLDRYVRSLLDIERQQVSMDAGPGCEDARKLQLLLDQVTMLRQEVLREFTAHELNEDHAVDSFVQMCHALSNKINAKITRQRFDRGIGELAQACAPRTQEQTPPPR